MSKLKRLAAPNFWPIERKVKKYAISPQPGPHSKKSSIPLGIIIRDILKLSQTLSETKQILNNGHVKIDNIVRKKYTFPVGFMDVLSTGEEHYRAMPTKNGIELIKINNDEASKKPLLIKNKKTISKNLTQLNFHDGSNLTVADDKFKTGDVVIFDLNDKKITDSIELKKNNIAIIVGGSNRGKIGKINDITVTKSPQPNQILINIGKKDVEIPKNYVFVIGHDKPAISVGGNDE